MDAGWMRNGRGRRKEEEGRGRKRVENEKRKKKEGRRMFSLSVLYVLCSHPPTRPRCPLWENEKRADKGTERDWKQGEQTEPARSSSQHRFTDSPIHRRRLMLTDTRWVIVQSGWDKKKTFEHRHSPAQTAHSLTLTLTFDTRFWIPCFLSSNTCAHTIPWTYRHCT